MKKKLFTAGILMMTAIALVAATVFVTVAYLTASSAVSNTFTVGNVNIALYESNVDSEGNKLVDTDVNGHMKDSDGNSYHLMPNKSYDKDPTVYIDAKSDKSYLFVKVKNDIFNIEKGNFVHNNQVTPSPVDDGEESIATQMAAYGWQYYLHTASGDVYVYVGDLIRDDDEDANNEKTLDDATITKITNKECAPAVVGGTGKEQIFNIFDTFTIDEHADVSIFGGAKVTLTGFAIQTSGFNDVAGTPENEALDAAWAAIVETYPYEDGASV